jgi:hypothetical protein
MARSRRSGRPSGARRVTLPNKGMKLTKPVNFGASQLIWSDRCQVPGVSSLPLVLLGDPRRR